MQPRSAPLPVVPYINFVTSLTVRTFDEAMELAYFGGQVLHPSAMVPCIEERIPVLVKCLGHRASPEANFLVEIAGDFRRYSYIYSKNFQEIYINE